MIKIFFFAISILLLACNDTQPADNGMADTQHTGKMYVEVQPFQSSTGWGYNIYVDKKLYISQSMIPGVAGAKGFKTKEDAVKVGILAVQKMSIKKSLPVITAHDLTRLHIDLN